MKVRFGSLADMLTSPRHLHFTPNNGRWAAHPSQHLGLSVCEYTPPDDPQRAAGEPPQRPSYRLATPQLARLVVGELPGDQRPRTGMERVMPLV